MGERAGDGERGAGAAAAMEEDAGGGDGGGQGQQERQQCQGRRPPPPRAPDEPADADDAAVRAIRITHVLSQSDVVRFLARRPRALGAAGALTLEQLGLARKGGRGVVCVPAAMPALHALSALMVRCFWRPSRRCPLWLACLPLCPCSRRSKPQTPPQTCRPNPAAPRLKTPQTVDPGLVGRRRRKRRALREPVALGLARPRARALRRSRAPGAPVPAAARVGGRRRRRRRR